MALEKGMLVSGQKVSAGVDGRRQKHFEKDKSFFSNKKDEEISLKKNEYRN